MVCLQPLVVVILFAAGAFFAAVLLIVDDAYLRLISSLPGLLGFAYFAQKNLIPKVREESYHQRAEVLLAYLEVSNIGEDRKAFLRAVVLQRMPDLDRGDNNCLGGTVQEFTKGGVRFRLFAKVHRCIRPR